MLNVRLSPFIKQNSSWLHYFSTENLVLVFLKKTNFGSETANTYFGTDQIISHNHTQTNNKSSLKEFPRTGMFYL